MLRILSNTTQKLSRFLSQNTKQLPKVTTVYKRSFASQFENEVITYDDTFYFPPEAGPIQNSIYSDKLILPKCRIDQYVWENFNQWHDKIAVVSGTTGHSYTYATLRDKSATFAVNLQKLGMEKNDVVGICMPNAPEYLVAALGIMESGCIVSSFNPIYTPDEICRQLVNSNAKVMVCWVDNYETIRKAVELSKRNIKIICAKSQKDQSIPMNAIDFYSLTDTKVNFSELKVFDFDPDDIGFLPYSSGTTGLPKGVMLTHKNMIANSEMVEINVEQVTQSTTTNNQESILCILPLFHIYGWISIFTSKLRLGCKIVTLPNFQPETFRDAIFQHKATILNLVPPLILFLGYSDLIKPEHMKSVRRISCGAAPLGGKDADAVRAKVEGVTFGQGYGMTETCCAAVVPVINNADLASPGFPCAVTQAKIVAVNDEEMKALGPNVSGELFIRGPQNMKGYLNNEQATKETLVANKWLRTGDIGYYDDEGKFYITDRLKELIKVKGFQVAPAELEEVLRSHPSIAEAAVVGAPNARSGEVPRAFVVAKANQKVSQDEIFRFLKEKVTHYKIPDQIVVVNSIPKSATGKILRREVKIQHGLV